MDFVTTTGNVIIDLLHNFHLECGARLHKLRVYETLTDPSATASRCRPEAHRKYDPLA
jgi:Mn-containing catalase